MRELREGSNASTRPRRRFRVLVAVRVAGAVGTMVIQFAFSFGMTVLGLGWTAHLLGIGLSPDSNRQLPGAQVAITVRTDAFVTACFALSLGVLGLILVVACWRENLPLIKKAAE